MMPVMTGMELYNHICKVAPEQAARMVVMTGGAYSNQTQQFLDSTQVRQLEKPFNLEAVRGMIEVVTR